MQLESKPLRGRRVVVRLGTSVVLFQSTNLPVRTRTRLQDSFVAYVLFGPGAVGTVNGYPVRHDRLLTSRSGIELDFVVAAGYESIAFLVPPDATRAPIQGRHGEDEFYLPHGFELLTPSASAVHRLYRWAPRPAVRLGAACIGTVDCRRAFRPAGPRASRRAANRLGVSTRPPSGA